MIRIAVVEDVPSERAEIEKKLQDLSNLAGELAVRCYASGEEILEALERRSFDLIFLDVRLDGISGLETAAQIRQHDRHVLIVFLTGWAEYVLEGYRYRAFRYLIKPVVPELLAECLRDASAELASVRPTSIAFGPPERRQAFAPDEVRFISTSGNYLTVHTVCGCVRFRERLKNLEKALPPQFVRIHRCEIVNVRHIRCLDGTRAVLSDGTCLTISRPNREKARQCFDAFH